MTTYKFDHFTMEYDEATQWVCTRFEDGTWSGGHANPDDKFHADLLGITPGEHRLIHEIAHHVVGMAYEREYCQIVWDSAHHLPMPPNANMIEWRITALTYFTLEKPFRHDHEWSAIKELAEVENVYDLKNRLKYIFLKMKLGT